LKQVQWIETREGNPLAFPDVGAIVKGERSWLPDGEAAIAIAGKLARLVTEPEAEHEREE
jgi:hypothetical protein